VDSAELERAAEAILAAKPSDTRTDGLHRLGSIYARRRQPARAGAASHGPSEYLTGEPPRK
jgi:hypothetical protein